MSPNRRTDATALPRYPSLLRARVRRLLLASGVLALVVVSRASAASGPLLLGVFPPGGLFSGGGIEQIASIDAWTGQAGGVRTSIAGTFLDLDQANINYNLGTQLETAWGAGTTPLVKMTTTRTVAAIASGAADASIRGWARAVASRVGSPGRTMYLALFPEMNWYINSYSLDPTNYKLSYRRIQRLFREEGVPSGKVRWVFAPNGYTNPGDPPFEDYYPGSDAIDVVGLSQYNWGFCPGTQYDFWDDPATTPQSKSYFPRFIQRLRALEPNRPLFVLQTASTSEFPKHGQFSEPQKDTWLTDSYQWFIDQGVRAVIYFNIDKECDWAFFRSGGVRSEGYRAVAKLPGVAYLSPAALANGDLTPPGPCGTSMDAACLRGGRFRVEASWRDPAGGAGSAHPVALGSDGTALLYFYGSTNWELLVKVIDACGAGSGSNGHYWVFAAAATSLETELVVTDTWTGEERTYRNALGHPASAVTDTEAFAGCGAQSPFAKGAMVEPEDGASISPPVADSSDDAFAVGSTDLEAAGSCTTSATTLCLRGGRFRVELDWQGFGSDGGAGKVAQQKTPDSGLFYFFGPDNLELLVKVLDGCGTAGGATNHYWVFAAAATTLKYDLRVTDTTTGAVRVWSNPLGHPSGAVADVLAFDTCP